MAKRFCNSKDENALPLAAGSQLSVTAPLTALLAVDAKCSREEQTLQHKANIRLQTKGKASKPQPAETLSPTALLPPKEAADTNRLAAINFYLVKAQSVPLVRIDSVSGKQITRL